MKIAIQGHPIRGEEVIQILESLGGKNKEGLKGTYETFYYIDDKNEIGDDHKKNFPPTYKLYTLEEFEKEFPFKIGDKVVHKEYDNPFEIVEFDPENVYPYTIDGLCEFRTKSCTLTKYQPKMKEERNITLSIDKAKEWYKKGGELREIALQAFTEKELNPLPRSWEEFCDNYPVKESEAMIGYDARIIDCRGIEGKRSYKFKDIVPSKQSAEAHLAMIQLEQLRDCWRQGWKPEWNASHKYAIINLQGEITVLGCSNVATFLAFPTREMAEEFLECFRDLIEKAKDLI